MDRVLISVRIYKTDFFCLLLGLKIYVFTNSVLFILEHLQDFYY